MVPPLEYDSSVTRAGQYLMVGNVPGQSPVIHGSWNARTAVPSQSVRLRAHAIALDASPTQITG